MNKRKTIQRQHWMAAFEQAVLAQAPHLAGKIDFANTGVFFFNEGATPQHAAERFIATKESEK